MIIRIALVFITSILLLSLMSCSGDESGESFESAEEIKLPADGIEIVDAWARPGSVNGVSAIYMNILNGSSSADTMVSISSPVAGMVEVHETYEQEEGMMGMRPAETVVAPAKNSVSFKPGGLHVMLMQLNRQLSEGDSLEFRIEFSNYGELTLTAPVHMMNR